MKLNIFEKYTPSPLLVEGHHHEAAVESLVEKVFETQNIDFPRSKAHMDWIHLSGEDLKMEELRDSLYRLRLKPGNLGVKILSITHFQSCNRNIQNALLKTLEEPLSFWKIFIGIKNAFGVLPTIRSRCLLYKLPQDSNHDRLDDAETKIFEAIEHGEDFGNYAQLEKLFKNREQFYSLMKKLLWEASHQTYPGHWRHFAPALEDKIDYFDRHIHPKVIWESSWNEAQC